MAKTPVKGNRNKRQFRKERFTWDSIDDIEIIEESPGTKEKQIPKSPKPNVDTLLKPKLLPNIFKFLKKKKSGRN